MSLSSNLDNTKAAVRGALPPATFAAIERSIADLRASGIAARAAGVGDLVALPTLRTIDDRPADLVDMAGGRPVVLLFYRGGWCPYHVGDFQTRLTPDGAGFRVNGEKFYATGALFAHYHHVRRPVSIPT